MPSGAPAAAPNAAAAPPSQPSSLLTSRERQIAALAAEGISNRGIAQRLAISKRTVDAHLEPIFGKLGISARVQLTTWPGAAGPVS